MPDRDFWLTIRQALLLIVSAIEKMLNIEPTTTECRKRARDNS
jgi:hypothetical protein